MYQPTGPPVGDLTTPDPTGSGARAVVGSLLFVKIEFGVKGPSHWLTRVSLTFTVVCSETPALNSGGA